jgi:hypothetical protein
MQPYPPPGFPPAPLERRKFGLLAALFLSFVSPELYRDVARRWRGIGFLYLVLLAIIVWVPTAFWAQHGYRKFVANEAPTLLKGFPTVSITDGIVTADPDPYLWRDPKSKQVIAYIDTSGAFDDPAGKNAGIKLSKSKLEYRQNAYETRSTDLSQIKSFYIDKQKAAQFLDSIGGWVGICVGLVGIFAVIWHLILILLYGVIGLLFCSMFNANLSYGALLRISAVALTPAVILGLVLGFARVQFPGEWLVYLALELFFLGVGVKANAAESGGPPGFPAYAYPQGQYPAQGYPPGQYPAQGYPPAQPGYPPPVPPGYRAPAAPGYPPPR